MKSISQLFLVAIFTALTFVAQAQYNSNNSKVEGAMGGFLKTEFMIKFQDMKLEAESMVEAFKRKQSRFSSSDVAKVRAGYEKTARRFNQVLTDIKNDFLNKEKLKVISKFPDLYADGLRADMIELNDYYATNFQQPLADVTNNSIDGSPVAILLVELIKLSSDVVSQLIEARRNARKYDEAYLDRYLIRNNAFKTWSQVGGSGFEEGGFENDGFGDDDDDDFGDNEEFGDDEEDGGFFNSGIGSGGNGGILNQGGSNNNQNNGNNSGTYDNIGDFEFEDKKTPSRKSGMDVKKRNTNTRTTPTRPSKINKPINLKERNNRR